jgi:hypothetical protein
MMWRFYAMSWQIRMASPTCSRSCMAGAKKQER